MVLALIILWLLGIGTGGALINARDARTSLLVSSCTWIKTEPADECSQNANFIKESLTVHHHLYRVKAEEEERGGEVHRG